MRVRKSLTEWLLWLEALHPKAIDLSLERLKPIAAQLSLTQFSCPVVAVAGTNGKGSTVTFLQTIAKAHGYRTAIYTSPHLIQFNERIVIHDKMASDEQIIEAFEAIDIARASTSLTYFEFTTLAALWLFKKQESELDLIVLEVGMGGRLDAVNIVENDVAVITSIDLDHTEWLGTTREQIGFEKAGIFKQKKVAVYGGLNLPQSVVQQAQAQNTALFSLKRDYDFFLYQDGNWSWQSALQYWGHLPKTNLLPINAATALMVFELLRPKLVLSIEKLQQALKQANLMGRFQVLSKNPEVIVDIAHNVESISILAERLKVTQSKYGKTKAVFSMLKDKAIVEGIEKIKDVIDEWYVAPLAVSRGCDLEQLKKAFFKAKVDMIHEYPDIRAAFLSAIKSSNQVDRIIVFGSFYTVANVMVL